MSILSQVEAFYGLPFAEAIQHHHWELKKTMLQISVETGIIRQSIMHTCKVNKVPIRSTRQHYDQVGAPQKENHWAWGLTKETSEHYRTRSTIMKARNPSLDEASLARRAQSISKTYRNRPWWQETEMKRILMKLIIPFKQQYPIERYIIDFYLPDFNLVVEVDSTRGWGTHRRKAAAIRDKRLLELGYPTLRICKTKLKRPGFLEEFRATLSTYQRHSEGTQISR